MIEKRTVYTLNMHELTAVNPTSELEQIIAEQADYVDPSSQKTPFYAEAPQTKYANNPNYQ